MADLKTQNVSWSAGKVPTIEDLERVIDLRAWEWPGHCFDVVRAILSLTDIDGVGVYGFWTGPVVPSSFYQGREPRLRHGWITTPKSLVIDPTRFVFERTAPYIYCGAGDHYADGQVIDWQLSPLKKSGVSRKTRRLNVHQEPAHRRRIRVRARTKIADRGVSTPRNRTETS